MIPDQIFLKFSESWELLFLFPNFRVELFREQTIIAVHTLVRVAIYNVSPFIYHIKCTSLFGINPSNYHKKKLINLKFDKVIGKIQLKMILVKNQT